MPKRSKETHQPKIAVKLPPWAEWLVAGPGAIVTAAAAAVLLTVGASALGGVLKGTSANIMGIEQLKAKYARPQAIPFPPENPYNEAKYELGKKLFFDTRFSSIHNMACASCHNPAFNWTDTNPTAIGRANVATATKTMALYNLAWDHLFTWNGSSTYLEEQAMAASNGEQGMSVLPMDIMAVINSTTEYRPLFEKAFHLQPGETIKTYDIYQAIATFERTIVSAPAPFDKWIEGQEDAISPMAKQGFLLFNGKAKCADCHTGWRFSDGNLYNIGNDPVVDEERQKRFTKFKAVGLRNIARRAPYMHNGKYYTLEDVIEFYNRGGDTGDPETIIHPLGLTDWEKKALVEFLKTLTSEDAPVSLPHLPPYVQKPPPTTVENWEKFPAIKNLRKALGVPKQFH
jgi:cytochrome c peroxidase